jgi:hypothetical protein
MNQCRNEHGLAGPRKPGDAKPQCRIEEALAEIPQRARRNARLLDHVGEIKGHALKAGKTGFWKGNLVNQSQSGD